jgi:hypothetical protein
MEGNSAHVWKGAAQLRDQETTVPAENRRLGGSESLGCKTSGMPCHIYPYVERQICLTVRSLVAHRTLKSHIQAAPSKWSSWSDPRRQHVRLAGCSGYPLAEVFCKELDLHSTRRLVSSRKCDIACQSVRSQAEIRNRIRHLCCFRTGSKCRNGWHLKRVCLDRYSKPSPFCLCRKHSIQSWRVEVVNGS